MEFRKKTAFGVIGAAATAALVTGTALPAFADDHESTTVSRSSATHVVTKLLGDVGASTESPVVVAPEVGVGDVLSGTEVGEGALSGNHVGSGNETASGNVVGSGNDTAIGSGNDTAIDGVDVDLSDLFDGSVGDVTGDVSDLLDDIDVSLDGMFED